MLQNILQLNIRKAKKTRATNYIKLINVWFHLDVKCEFNYFDVGWREKAQSKVKILLFIKVSSENWIVKIQVKNWIYVKNN